MDSSKVAQLKNMLIEEGIDSRVSNWLADESCSLREIIVQAYNLGVERMTEYAHSLWLDEVRAIRVVNLGEVEEGPKLQEVLDSVFDSQELQDAILRGLTNAQIEKLNDACNETFEFSVPCVKTSRVTVTVKARSEEQALEIAQNMNWHETRAAVEPGEDEVEYDFEYTQPGEVERL